MPNRPAIPAEIVREILIESGHRCAVCGAGCPLERAHIIPWHKSKEHKAGDLICLCANCHQRADLERWGEKVLREYKQRPWVMRQYEKADTVPEIRTKVHIDIDMELDRFDEMFQRLLQSGLAGFLEISPNSVRITSMEKGSVKVIVELPLQSAERLLNAYKRNDPELVEYLAPLVLLDLREEAEHERIQARDMRRTVADTLGKLGDPRAVESLIAALKDSDERVRRRAAEALRRLGGLWAAEVLGKPGSAAVEPLIAALRDSDSDVRRTAADALGKLGDARAVEPLIAALKDSDWWVRWEAAKALGKLGDPRAVESLIAALKDSDERVRSVAIEALRRIGTPEARAAVIVYEMQEKWQRLA